MFGGECDSWGKFFLKNIENTLQQTIEASEYYTAILQKGEDQLYTAWWYQSGETRTIEEWDWRWDNLKSGADFYLVNISCGSRSELESWTKVNLKGI